MQNNADIYQAFIAKVNTTFGASFQVSYEGYSFTPPASGVWLEVKHLPNDGVDQSISGSSVIAQGMFQINVVNRKENGISAMQTVAELVQVAFPKASNITGLCRVSRAPYQSTPLTMDDRIIIGVTIPYSE